MFSLLSTNLFIYLSNVTVFGVSVVVFFVVCLLVCECDAPNSQFCEVLRREKKKFGLSLIACGLFLFVSRVHLNNNKKGHFHINLLCGFHSALQRRADGVGVGGSDAPDKMFPFTGLVHCLTNPYGATMGCLVGCGFQPLTLRLPENRCLNTDNYTEPNAPKDL